MKLDLAVILMSAAIVGYAVFEKPVSRLDKAQATFEHRDKWPTPEDFKGWRVSGALKCRDFPSLRICEAIFPFFDDGKPVGKDRVAFACSPEDCQWVDP